ncbi:TRIM56 [Mytilus edulis]|uniref:TRIM56 n=1 Tax=Mytilus edulis TaxID=6550 RepID=A0A8S3R1S2_MYTED|nr:TRIM56 [Mytilus edulis]
MAEADIKTIESDSKCRICLSFYTEPRLLSCYHTFCTPCLAKLEVQDKNIACPLCRMKTCLPENSVNTLQLYPFQLKGSNEERNPLDICGLCTDDNIAVAKCEDCTVYLCLNCRDYHGKLKTSKNHVIESFEQSKLEQIIGKSLDDVREECKDHKKDTTLFCKPCNLWLCSDCSEKSHRRHKVQNLAMLIQSKKKMLLNRTTSLKSRISVLGNVVELIKQEENRYYKHCNIVKTNVKVHAEYDFVNKSPDKKFWREFPAIGKHLDNVLKKPENALQSLHRTRYVWGEYNEAKIEELFGKVTSKTSIGTVIRPVYPSFALPEILYKANKLSSFKLLKNDAIDMLPAEDGTVLILTEKLLSKYNYEGKLCSSYCPPANIYRVLKNSRNELLFWGNNQCAMKQRSTTYEECFRVSFKTGLAGSLIHNGNLLVYNTEDNLIYEVSDQDGIQNKIRIVDPENKLQSPTQFIKHALELNKLKRTSILL